MWKINDVLYASTTLPDKFEPSSYGLMIPVVKTELNATKFQCFVGGGYQYFLRSSSIGTLYVVTGKN